jgi:hypothetical protein
MDLSKELQHAIYMSELNELMKGLLKCYCIEHEADWLWCSVGYAEILTQRLVTSFCECVLACRFMWSGFLQVIPRILILVSLLLNTDAVPQIVASGQIQMAVAEVNSFHLLIP